MSDPKYKNIGDPITCTIEECAEVIHVLCKVRRFGWGSFNPYDSERTPNIVLVRRELSDLKTRINELETEMNKVSHFGDNDH
jgi:hypothetical protein